MKTRPNFRSRTWLAGRLAAGAIALAAVLRPARADSDDQSAAPPAPERVGVQNGAAVVKLKPDEIARIGLELSPPAAATQEPRQPAFGAVVDLQPLFDSAAGYAAARADAERTAAAAAASQAAFARAQRLHGEDQNVSTRDLQAAEAAARGDQAAAHAAAVALEGRRAALAQQWGLRLAGWIAGESPEYRRLLVGEVLLVQVTPAVPGYRAAPPADAWVRRPDGQWVTAALVSATGRASPEFQAEGWYFTVETGGGLRPGLNTEARLPAAGAAADRGVVIPAAAVVWWQGRAWVYQQTAPGVFTRREITTDQPADGGGYFVADFPAGGPVVVRGAQALLSEEDKPAGAED